ncbi:MAG: response regulator [Planctomycetes bacterium]|nr:response regulator [Planctomycetota bacterium]
MTQCNKVILYAEDDEDDAFLFQHAFKQAGISHRLVVVPNGKTAIEYLSGDGAYADRVQHPLPSLVLMDLKMPGISGLEVLKWIRTSPSLSTLLVVMVTSSNQDTDIHRAYLQGANGYLVKPGNIDAIVTMARSIKDYWLMQNRVTGWVEVKMRGQS